MIRKITLASIIAFSAIAAAAQPKVKLSKNEFDLGNVGWHQQATASFKITNSGNKPLVINDVDTGCECTVANWSNTPIAPGNSTTITAVYNAETLGTFQRDIAIKTNAEEAPTYVVLRGCVKVNAVDLSAFTYKVDHVLLSSALIEFDDVTEGDHPEVTISVMNNGKKDYVPTFMHLPKWLSCRVYPEVLKPGRQGRVTFTLNSEELPAMGLTQASIYVARNPGDKVHKSNEMSVCATLLPKTVASAATAEGDSLQDIPAPLAVIPTEVDMGAKFGKKKARSVVYIENTGTAPLHVAALQVYNPAITVELADATVAPGEKVALKVTTNSNVLQHKQHPRILIITDDPKHPKIDINLVGGKKK